MNIQDSLFVEIEKRTKEGPWLATVQLANGPLVSFSMGQGGDVPVGPKLASFLKEQEEKIEPPFVYGCRHLSNPIHRYAIIRWMGGKPRLIESTERTLRFFSETFPVKNEKKIVEETLPFYEERIQTFAVEEMEPNNADTNPYKYFFVGRLANEEELKALKAEKAVLDGDTIHFTIEKILWNGETAPSQIGKYSIGEGKTITVRYLGVDSFETKKENDGGYAEKENIDAAKRYGTEISWIYECADEAKEVHKELLKNNNKLLLAMQYNKKTKEASADKGSGKRPVGVIFDTGVKSIESVSTKMIQQGLAVNINKTLLKRMYSKNKEMKISYPKARSLPLAEWTSSLSYEPDGAIDTELWRKELGLNYPPSIGEGYDNQDEKITAESVNPDMVISPGSYYGFTPNDLSFVSPYDDRVENQEIYTPNVGEEEAELPFGYRNQVRIGDVLLTIPPLSIGVDRVSVQEKSKALRSKSSLQRSVAKTETRLTLDLYFHDLENINGREIVGIKTTNSTFPYYMDGLRTLIASFKTTPFLPIDNDYINHSLGIHNVALHSLSLETVPNFPESISAKLVLTPFESEGYLLGQKSLGDLINYPLLRWYQQRMLQKPPEDEPWRTYLEPIDELTNTFTFGMVEEDALLERKEAFQKIRNMKSIQERKEDYEGKEADTGKRREDASRAKKILRHYNNYVAARKEFKPGDDVLVLHPMATKLNVSEDEREKARYRFISTYAKEGNNDKQKEESAIEQTPYYGNSSFIPKGLLNLRHPSEIEDFTKGTDFDLDNIDGVFFVGFLDENNQDLFRSVPAKKDYRDDGSKSFVFPATETWISKLNRIVEDGELLKEEEKQAEDEYNSLLSIINSTENDMPMREVIIDDFLPQSLSVVVENQLSSQTLQGSEYPSLQYLGAQDPSIQVSFETTNDGVKHVEDLLKTCGRYVREYREGIVSGFLSIKHPLLKMLGISAVLPEYVNYSNVPNFPNRHMVTMVLTAFDRTQRRQEKLYGMSAGTPDQGLKERHFRGYDPRRDGIIIENQLRQMEVYPDLELPRVDELLDVLPYLDAKVEKWENYRNQIFLDPDFYVSTQKTYQSLFYEIVHGKEGVEIEWKDQLGIHVTSKSNGKAPFESNPEMLAKIKEIEEGVKGIDPRFKWDSDTEYEEEEETPVNEVDTPAEGDPVDFKEEEVRKYLTIEAGDAPFFTPPTYEEYKAMPGFGDKNESDYQAWLNHRINKGEEEIFLYLGKAIFDTFGKEMAYVKGENKVFGSTPDNLGENIEESYINKQKNQTDGRTASFASSDVWGQHEGYALSRFQKELNLFEDTIYSKKEANYGYRGLLDGGTLSKNDLPKVPFQRIFSYLRAIMLHHSGWYAYDSTGRPVATLGKTSNGSELCRVGIMGVDVRDVGINTARMLAWDWKKNIKMAVSEIFSWYKKCKQSRDIRIRANALEWAIVFYGERTLPTLYLENTDEGKKAKKGDEFFLGKEVKPLSSAYFSEIEIKFKKHFSKITKDQAVCLYTGGREGVLPSPYALLTGMTGPELKAFLGDKETIVNQMVDVLYYPLHLYDFKNDWFGNDIEDMVSEKDETKTSSEKKKAKSQLNALSNDQLRQKYFQHMLDLKETMEKTSKTTWKDLVAGGVIGGIAGGIIAAVTVFFTGGAALLPIIGAIAAGTFGGVLFEATEGLIGVNYGDADKIMDSFEGMSEANQAILKNKKLHTWETEEVFKSMFTDMLAHDMQGRLVRAFPTFSMFLVDEGKWFSNYRTWDNFYGYNALSSIDVYKSRKIAADTAVISMSNLYSGLSSRRIDMQYPDLSLPSFFSNLFWEKYVFGKPGEEYLDVRRDTLQELQLQTGARIHLRMGYGSDALRLPVVFNGTITEMTSGEEIEIICQGDGVELTNAISEDPDDKNKRFFQIQEPSEFLCHLLTSKGNWLKDVLNYAGDGEIFRDNPLGIVHFGSPFLSPKGTILPFNDEYGECAQNIYSQNGLGNHSQWMNAEGEDMGITDMLFSSWNNIFEKGIMHFKATEDEDNILVPLFGNTVWDILQTFAYCSEDYIGAVIPYEMRSTMFFGKPHWPVTYGYDSEYQYDEATESWTRTMTKEHQKSFMQARYYSSKSNLIANKLIASEEGTYTNCIVRYDGKVAPIVYADRDIRMDKQRTVSVEANLVARISGLDKWTSEAQAQKYAHSTVRDYMKDMYKGTLSVSGDPSVKPHDICYLSDEVLDMNGTFGVKAVTHHFSYETGFMSSIEPDAIVTNWDYQFLGLIDKVWGVGKQTTVNVALATASFGAGKFLSSFLKKGMNGIKELPYIGKIEEKALTYYLDSIDKLKYDPDTKAMIKQYQLAKGDGKKEAIQYLKKKVSTYADEVKSLKNGIKKKTLSDLDEAKKMLDAAEEALDAAKNAKKLARSAKSAKTIYSSGKNIVKVATMTTPLSIAAQTVVTMATASLMEGWRRKKQDMECVKIFPLQYRNNELTAGINGRRGAVWGDLPSSVDKIYHAQFFDGNDEHNNLFALYTKTMNFLSNDNGTFEETGPNNN